MHLSVETKFILVLTKSQLKLSGFQLLGYFSHIKMTMCMLPVCRRIYYKTAQIHHVLVILINKLRKFSLFLISGNLIGLLNLNNKCCIVSNQ